MRLLGGTLLQAAFAGDPAASTVELLPQGSEEARDLLSGLECFIYRKHPQFFETCGACILEAMPAGAGRLSADFTGRYSVRDRETANS